MGRVSPFTRSYLLEAHPVSFNTNLLTIGFDPEFADHLQLVDNAKNRTLIQTKLSELGLVQAQVKFVRAEAPASGNRQPQPVSEATLEPAPLGPARPSPGAAREKRDVPQDKPKLEPIPGAKEDFKNDPLIRKALEIFKGQIVEVRA